MAHAHVLDLTSDTGKQILHRIMHKHSAPAYVAPLIAQYLDEETTKTAAQHFVDGPVSAYAVLRPTKALPCHTKAAAWLSHAYYLEQRAGLSEDAQDQIESFLAKQAEFWDIQSDIEALANREAQILLKEASYTTSVPLRNVDEIGAATRWFSGNARKMAKHEGIDRVIKVAGEILTAIDSNIQAYLAANESDYNFLSRAAGRGGCHDGVKVAAQIRSVPVGENDVSLRDSLADTAATLYGEDLQQYFPKMASVIESIATSDVDIVKILAPDNPVRTVKLANLAVVSLDDVKKLSGDDWLKVGHWDSIGLGGAPMGLEDLTVKQAGRLCDILKGRKIRVAGPAAAPVSLSVLR